MEANRQLVFDLTFVNTYIVPLLLFFLSWIVLRMAVELSANMLSRIAEKTKHTWDDAIQAGLSRLGSLFYSSTSLFLLVELGMVHEKGSVLSRVAVAGITISIVRAGEMFIARVLSTLVRKSRGDRETDHTILHFLQTLTRVVLWLGGLLFILDNFGYKVTTFLGGLGILGIAVAFAMQTILEDIFAFFSIYFDKPLERGDVIAVGADRGEVAHIGIKSTRIKTLQGEELVISNRELTNIRINNYKKMKTRTVVFPISVTYETPQEKLQKIPEMINEICKKIPDVQLDRVHFVALAESSLNFEIAYTLPDSDFMSYRNTHQKVLFAIMERFATENISFAYPTRVVYRK